MFIFRVFSAACNRKLTETCLSNKKTYLTKLKVQRQDKLSHVLKDPLFLHLCHGILRGLSFLSDLSLSGHKRAGRVPGITRLEKEGPFFLVSFSRRILLITVRNHQLATFGTIPMLSIHTTASLGMQMVSRVQRKQLNSFPAQHRRSSLPSAFTLSHTGNCTF